MEIHNIEEAVHSFKTKRVLIVGDVMLDHYSYGKVSRISPEAPVPIVEINEERFVPGGAGNVFLNLCEFGSIATLISVVGCDVAAEKINKTFEVSTKCGDRVFFQDQRRRTTIKHRLIAGRQQLLRVDTEDRFSISEEIENKIARYVADNISSFDCICISDYAKGVMTRTLAEHIITNAEAQHIPVLVDTKPANFGFYKKCTLITPNESEILSAYPNMSYKDAAQALAADIDSPVLVTRGAKGVAYVTKEGEEFTLPSYAKEEEVRDVSGAGDTVVAALTLCLSSNLTAEQSVYIASKAAAIAITKPYTSAVTTAELLEIL